MNYDHIKKVLHDVLDISTSKVEGALVRKDFDCECYEVMAQAIDNIKDLCEIEEYQKAKEIDYAVADYKKLDAQTETTEFETVVYDILKKHPSNEGMVALTTVIAEHVEDVKIMHPRLYENLMLKLGRML